MIVLFESISPVVLTAEQEMIARGCKTLDECPPSVRYSMNEVINNYPLGYKTDKERCIEYYWKKSIGKLRGFLAIHKNHQWYLTYGGLSGYTIREWKGKTIMEWNNKNYRSIIMKGNKKFVIPKRVNTKKEVISILEQILAITGEYNVTQS